VRYVGEGLSFCNGCDLTSSQKLLSICMADVLLLDNANDEVGIINFLGCL